MPSMRTSKRPKTTKFQLRTRRVFSDSFKRLRVREIEDGVVTVNQIARAYRVAPASVYRWLKHFSKTVQPGERIVVELESEAARTLALQKRNEELERIIGQKQLLLDYYERLLLVASEELGFDVKKNFDGKRLTGSTPTNGKESGQ